VFDLGISNSSIDKIEAVERMPGESSIQYYFRFSDEIAGWTGDDPVWVPFLPGTALEKERYRGRYLQFRMNFQPDALCLNSPELARLIVHYFPDMPPPPPAFVAAVADDGRITLHWSPVSETDITGYLIYYGVKSGQYWGSGALQGKSPVIIRDPGANSFVLTGLNNDTLYYIAIAAMDSAEPPHIGEFSYEITARPMRVKQ